ncbi:branched-chain amino acid transport system substrate-binding protein [Comamonas sp. BIGb0124]|uniref:ABC transporter substrate-binding protein n=1 Tax=Comamonas sp. BIGb0124 TaxID=2485130 RepID=UPI000F4658F9|nr:ABC transporter substrate-binding protein [Comamonas sp. BIGb0124]ROR23077.1 branched-chain amino acid transport system substrate-binding protein [Comamonas sp. BIGb0124]
MNTQRTGKLALHRRALLASSVIALAAWVSATIPAHAADKLVVGTILPLSGAFADQGSHYETGMRLYQQVHGSQVAGRDIQIVTRDDQGPGSGDLARRLTQELIARDKAEIIAGYSFTPNAMVAANVLSQAKTPGIVINAMTSVITEKSPYFTRVSATMPMVTYTLGKWATENGIKSAYLIVSDYAPGIDAETWFINGFEAGGGKILGKDRTPLTAMEYGPYLQRAIEAKPDAVFAFNPGGDVSIAFMKQAGVRLDGTGIKLMVTGDVVDDNLLGAMGTAVKDVISAWHYQADLDNAANQAFIQAFKAKYGAKAVPSYRVVQGYDAMEMIYRTLEKTKGKTGDAFMEAVKGSEFSSPRGTFSIDPQTRDIIENIYIRRGVLAAGAAMNKRIATIQAVKDPSK